MALTTEVVCYNILSAQNAQKVGADRIELCDNPGGGGTTPSAGTIEVVREITDLTLFVMIRPREGDFCYSDHEFEAMKRDINHCKRIGADGVVFGLLDPTGRIDRARCSELIELARPLGVTCHRAFDVTRDPLEALEYCIAAGFDRILTSGQKATVVEGLPLIKQLHEKAGKRISIMAGCGINEENAAEVVRTSGVREIHISAETSGKSKMQFKNEEISGMGSVKGGEYTISYASAERIRAIRKNALAAVQHSIEEV